MTKKMSINEAEALFGFASGEKYDARKVKKVYRRLVKENHPDAVRGKVSKEDATAKMVSINDAYATLEDAVRNGSVVAGSAPFGGTVEDAFAYAASREEPEYDWFYRREREAEREAAREEQRRRRAAEDARNERCAAWARGDVPVGRVYNWTGSPMDAADAQAAEARRAEAVKANAAFAAKRGGGSSFAGGFAATAAAASADAVAGAPFWFRAVRSVLNCEALWRIVFMLAALWLFNSSAVGGTFMADNQPLMLAILLIAIINLVSGLITKQIRRIIVAVLDALGRGCGALK